MFVAFEDQSRAFVTSSRKINGDRQMKSVTGRETESETGGGT